MDYIAIAGCFGLHPGGSWGRRHAAGPYRDTGTIRGRGIVAVAFGKGRGSRLPVGSWNGRVLCALNACSVDLPPVVPLHLDPSCTAL